MPTFRTAVIARRALASFVLLAAIAGAGTALTVWKQAALDASAATAAAQPEPVEAVESALVQLRPYVRTTTAIGTARALQSITLRNELPGTVHRVHLETGQVVDAGALLVELDVAVEQAELAALEAEANLAASMLGRMERALQNQGASAADVDRARAEQDKAVANVARMKALIERKRIHAPFRARVGLVDLHPGQYLEAGTVLTTLQGIDAAVHIDFSVTQEAAAALAVDTEVEVTYAGLAAKASARIVALDARVDQATRNTWIRARLQGVSPLPQPGASVRVRVPVAQAREVATVPVSALRRGPSGDHVFVIETTADGRSRARTRRVQSGATLGDFVLVVEGLEPGERVAAGGSFKLREGVLVHEVVAAAPTSASARTKAN